MIEFRPHHFMCTLGFEGKGYSEPFVANFYKIASLLRTPDGSGDQVSIKIVSKTDSICIPCPNRKNTACLSESKIQTLDRAHESILGFKPGTTIKWGEAKKLILEKMSDEAFESACAPCSWKALGVCKAALVRLREETQVLL